jgi:hypothetical protein
MGTIAWIALSMAAGLLANTGSPGKRSRAVIFICLTCFTGPWSPAGQPACSACTVCLTSRPSGSRTDSGRGIGASRPGLT